MSRGEDHGDAPGGPDPAQLSKTVALGVERHRCHPVGEEVEDANARVAVVHSPFLLQATVQFKMLRYRISMCSLPGVQLFLFILIPFGHPSSAARRRNFLSRVGVVLWCSFLWRRHHKGHTEHVGHPLLLVGVPSTAGLVQLLGGRNRQTHRASQHVRTSRSGAGRCMECEPDQHAEEHQGTGDVDPVETHDVARWRRSMHPKASSHDQLEVQDEENDADHMVGVHLGDGQRGEIPQVLSVLGGLGHGEVVS
mmetsp:Transcript_72903/g.147548  ORF Transcript_72903/g.147548 Transcript_72903/m.147548 type:complete len:252 (-) Transcript_72903:145-900(-)